MERQSAAVRFLTGNEAEMVELINFQGARFDAIIPNPELGGKVGEPVRGSLAINKLTGMPVIAAPFTINGVAGLLVSDHQMTCHRAMKEKSVPSSFLHEGINAAGKLLPAYEGFDELTGGRFAGFGSSTAIDTASYGAISYMRDNKLTIDNSIKYIYQELMNINGDIDQQAIPEESARALFKSGLSKANEALNSLKGDGLRTAMRRSIAIETFIMFVYKSNPQAFNQAVANYQQAIRQQIANNPDKQTAIMTDLEKSGKNGTELLKNMDALAKVIVEEAEQGKEVFLQTGAGDRPVNQIDEAFILELLETLADPNKPSMSQAVLNAEVFALDAIQAGAKMVGRLDKLAKGAIKTYNDIVPFLPTLPRGESEEVVVNRFSAWLSTAFNQDFSQLPFHYFNAKGANGSFTGNSNDAFFGMGDAKPTNQSLSDAIFGAQGGAGANSLGGSQNNLKGAFDSILNKLGGSQSGVGSFGGQPQAAAVFGAGVQGSFGGAAPTASPGFGQNQQPGYADSINNMLKGNNNNQGGNNMWIGQGTGFGAQQNNYTIIVLNGVEYAMDINATEATPHGVAARVYNAAGQLVGGALVDGRCMDMQFNYAGTATLKQQVQQGFGVQPQAAGFGASASGFGVQPTGFGGGGFGAQPQAAVAGFGGVQGGFGGAQAGFGQTQAGFGNQGLRANPINQQGFGARMSMI